jgi:bifunctional non-homologous end joining protein LigD
MRPMLATPTRRVPTGPEWAHEVKWDGMRILADIHDGQVRLTSRTERDVTVAFPELAGLANEFEDMLLDGEAVVLRDGIPSFAALAERFHVTSPTKAAALAARAPVTLMVFDLLRLYGVDLTGRSWTDRRATLERLELQGPHWTVPPTFTDGQALWEATREQGLEGIVSKRRSGRYAAGARTEDWVKLPHRTSQSVVIGGWRPETDQVGPARGRPRRRAGGWRAALPGAGRVGDRRQDRQGARRRPGAPDLRREPVRRRGAPRGRLRHHLGPSGACLRRPGAGTHR